MAWYDVPLGALKTGWEYVTGGSLYSDVSDYYEGSYLDTAYDKVSGVLGMDDGTTAAPNYRPPSFNTGPLPSSVSGYQSATEGDIRRRVSSFGYSPVVPVEETPGLLSRAYDSTMGYVKDAQEAYGAFSKSPLGQFVDGVVGYGAGKGAPDMRGIPVRTVQAPGVSQVSPFRSTPVDLSATYADPRISNSMAKALTSEVPQIRLAVQTINPNRRGGVSTIALGGASVKAPKIRKIKSKTAKASTKVS